jgi:hypothetical protein
MVRKHHWKILPSSLPHKNSSNAINVEPTLAHVVYHYRTPGKRNETGCNINFNKATIYIENLKHDYNSVIIFYLSN